MKKVPYESHFLAINALINGNPLNGRNGYDEFKCSRISNIIVDFRKEGILIDEKASAKSAYSHYKPYRLVQTEMNISRAIEVREKYQKLMDFYLSKRAA